jgi:glycerol-1-phosphate dehydrogenase [NAD(P)+]
LPQEFHYMQLPREVIVGDDILGKVGETCSRLGFSGSVLIVTDPNVQSIGAAPARDSLRSSGFSVQEVLVEAASLPQVRLVEREIEELKPTVVAGVGGGRDIDVAKLSSANKGIPFLSIPTAASHDGIASPVVSMKGYDKPYSFMAQAPIAIIADVGVIGRAPFRMLASGCGDVVGKYTSVRDWRLAHRIKNEYYGDYAADLALMSARLVMRHAHLMKTMSEAGIRTVVEALVSCGVAMSIAGSSRPCSGAEHLFSHALDVTTPRPALHGEQVGVGAIMCAYLHGANWQLIRDVLRKIGAPTCAHELGIEDEHVVKALTIAHTVRPDRYTILGEKGLTKEAAERVAQVTGVIQ